MGAENIYFEKNIEVLRRKNPEAADRVRNTAVPVGFSSVGSRKGPPVLKFNNITFHSVYDPQKEADKLIENIAGNGLQRVSILGLGSGYHIRSALKRGLQVRVYEPCPEIVRASMDVADLSDILSKVDLVFDHPPAGDDILDHPPSRKYYLVAADPGNPSAKPAAPVIRKKRDRLKVLVVSPVYGGSYPTAQHCVNALKKIGHDALFLDNASFNAPLQTILNMKVGNQEKNVLNELLMHLTSEMAVAACSAYKPDMVLCLAQAPLSIKAVERLKAAGIVTAFWFVEDYLQMDYWHRYAPHYDFYFTIQQGAFFEELKKLGVSNYYYLPQCADIQTHHPLNNNGNHPGIYASDLSFMGAGYYNRQKFFLGLLDYNFKIWGTEWPEYSILSRYVQKNGERISTEETVKIFNASKINLNLHSSVCHEGVDPDGDFLNPRTFEIASCEAFQLVDYRSMLPLHFDVDKEIVCFSTLEEARQKIDYYLEHPSQREKIAHNARARVLAAHSFEHRMREMLQVVERGCPDIFYRYGSAIPEITDGDEFCRKFPEARQIIHQAQKTGPLDIDHIASAVQTVSTTLDYPGALFLLLKDFHDRFQDGEVVI